tara:strand:+ start:320 stop:526 length:207 start_codon:yes stop_codon:yes gene_type:complete
LLFRKNKKQNIKNKKSFKNSKLSYFLNKLAKKLIFCVENQQGCPYLVIVGAEGSGRQNRRRYVGAFKF